VKQLQGHKSHKSRPTGGPALNWKEVCAFYRDQETLSEDNDRINSGMLFNTDG